MYERGLFKHLKVSYYHFHVDQDVVTQLISFNGLMKLFIDRMHNGTDLSALINLFGSRIKTFWLKSLQILNTFNL